MKLLEVDGDKPGHQQIAPLRESAGAARGSLTAAPPRATEWFHRQ